jgi:hypothetical protein
MRYATIPGWVYVMLIVMGIGFMAGAGAFILYVAQPTGTIVGVIWLVMGASFVFFSLRALRGRRDDERIRHEGTPATATLLGAQTTGLIINNVPQWKLRLRIDGAGASYETALKLSTYSPPANGATFTVRIDPVNRQHVVLAGDDGASPAGNTTTLNMGSGDLGAAIAAALQQAGQGQPGTTSVINPDALRQAQDDSRTITSTTFSAGYASDSDPAETVKLLAELDRMHASGALGDTEFDTLKRKLLGET